MKNGSGWKGESHRHRLAGMGIKTSKSKVIKISQEMKLDIKEDIKTIKNNIEGMSPDNIEKFLPWADYFLVATGVSDSFEYLNPSLVTKLSERISG